MSEVFYDSASQNIMFIFVKQSLILQKNIKLSYLYRRLLFSQKKLKTCIKNAVFTLNAYDHLFLMSVNGKNDVIKGPVLPSVLRLANQIRLDKIFLAKPYFQSKQLLVLLSKRHFGGKILEVCI